ncbi:MAG: hemerythrin domain-containing protein [Chloroflexi bacterium]|nr:hemerythrin domain-containing protein [Chloroflexota bacterium]
MTRRRSAASRRAPSCYSASRPLTAHEVIEEEIFYPALKEHPKAKELVLEAYEEHHVVDQVMAEFEQTSVEDEVWGAKFTVMKENIEHHIEEEEGEMFPQARQVCDKEELRALGEQMAVRKEQALQDPSLASQSQ